MKKIILLVVVMAFAVTMLTASESKTESLKIDGMTCQSCVDKVSGALKEVKGVESVEVDLESGLAKVTHNGSVMADLSGAVTKAGFSMNTGEGKAAGCCSGAAKSGCGDAGSCDDEKVTTKKKS
jgi:copper chaperone